MMPQSAAWRKTYFKTGPALTERRNPERKRRNGSLLGHQEHLQGAALGTRLLIHLGDVRQILHHSLQNAQATILVHNLAPRKNTVILQRSPSSRKRRM